MKKTILMYGCLAGCINLILMTSLMPLWWGETINMRLGEVIGYTSMIIAFTMVFLGVKSYRDNHLGGSISFGEAFLTGLYITIIASLIYVIGWIIFSRTSGIDFIHQYITYMTDEMRKNKATEAEIQQKLQEMQYFKEMYQNIFFEILITFLEIFPIGFVISLLSAVILKKKKVV